MTDSPSTCWTIIHRAAQGASAERDEFARRYQPVVEAYLASRWRGGSRAETQDAVQEVFLECFKAGGALETVDPERAGGFRGFLYGLVRNVARRIEERARRHDGQAAPADLDAIASDDPTLSRVFDRAWAESILREAAARQARRAEAEGAHAMQRVEILRLKFQQGLPIREVAARLEQPAARVHHEYARARDEFKAALLEVMAFYHPDSPGRASREAAALFEFLE